MVAVGIVIAVGLGCTKPNPRSCADGLCTDPAFPFCDVDGALEGLPAACIAVACTPDEFVACRGDRAIRCNATGNDYDLVQCDRGCAAAAGGCKGCQESSDCATAAPYCDPESFACRACNVDDECSSLVCDIVAGTCLSEAEVVYAAPLGIDSQLCTMTSPCTAVAAVSIAGASPVRSTVRFLPGEYYTSLNVNSGAITLVGSGATLKAQGTGGVLNVGRGADLTIRGLRFDLTLGNLNCGGGLNPMALGGTLHLRDLTVEPRNNHWFNLYGCVATLRGIVFDGDGTNPVIVRDGSSLDVDRARFVVSLGTSYILLEGSDVNVSVKNSLFDGVAISIYPQASAPTSLVFAYNTMVTRSGIAFYRSLNGGLLSAIVENNVLLASPTAPDALFCPPAECTMSHNVVFPQAVALPASNIVGDPKLVNPQMRDFHLRPDSPAVDAAMSSAGNGTEYDLEGVSRPQGPSPDIGAFELVP